ncbi:hypothetical protein LEP1GSC062_2024 [Leptospira alexanderi serovar Manhao 3 str. L 60]|uniref:Uncharacterized protein n=1 Tax=Leptospira alexanderi serovar Manhao 3 str. L 60 TaxID=1049759 RepID=V6I273_9LEPT|nr:hypothetical protein LEP1GSC062_4241 [Leptospira alexanderi serovar Manhao 3 str. L 60]EQA64310.1 hypothetical protein LEP1GSC062_2024 [Leptospira alexanderi serovar Manhao 3 str. L 60]
MDKSLNRGRNQRGKEMVKTLTLELPVATGEALEKLNLAGIWKDREIGDSTVKKEVSESEC